MVTKTRKHGRLPKKFRPGCLAELDGRLLVAKELRRRYDELVTDLGGLDSLSYAQRSLAEHAIWLGHWLMTQERRLAEGSSFDAGSWVQSCNALSGLYKTLGLRRVPRDVQDLQTYLRKRQETTA